MAQILLGITLVLWSLSLLGLAAISSVIIGIFALITGVLYILGAFTTLPDFTRKS